MGFIGKWMGWMECLVSHSSMSILVKGSPTKDFTVSRGLHQGNGLSLFLFLIVVERLFGLVTNVVSLGDFKGFYCSDNSSLEFLQFADNTILAVAGFLSCGIRALSFTFLRVSIGINPRRWDVWKPIMDKIRIRFRYGDTTTTMLKDPIFKVRSKVSLWWKDLFSIGKVEEENQDN
ncbi:uncharacterized protein LOC127135846 [Lathyrus oleraceus]|uniref:uncharacterized protein LOC127135846 n=1 Tax=Pisum sativum TaxID=3888 RepID=UPI0021D270E1|nr:uncharacterized protein LOC127135846 [Pisum sativum]